MSSTAMQLYRLEAAASALGISHWTVRSWVRQGLVKTIRLGKLKMVPKGEIDRIAKEGIAKEDRGTPVASPKERDK